MPPKSSVARSTNPRVDVVGAGLALKKGGSVAVALPFATWLKPPSNTVTKSTSPGVDVDSGFIGDGVMVGKSGRVNELDGANKLDGLGELGR